ncbi:hypothetical protein [Pseudidiomarina sediminum]|uniref:hypothetical protein n=1 Tax=Pseudidiomarina sediminum TaxID=431675 RepID=UPI001C9830FD|nr:hypothetical protein [Pseudidiomarina sediminum]MBY6063801.1 hypothetical protein [Pseudidiomarina sediminum]
MRAKKGMTSLLAAGCLLATASTTAAAEETQIFIEGELVFSSLPMLSDYQGPLAEPLLFSAVITEDATKAVSSFVFGLSEEYQEATRALQMEIRTAAGEVLYSEVTDESVLASANFVERYALFAYEQAAQTTGYPSGSAFWALIAGGDTQFVDREIALGADIASRGVGMGGSAGIANLFANTEGYPELVEGSYSYAFLYYDETYDTANGEGYQGLVQGYATRISFGVTDADNDGIDDSLDQCPASATDATVVFNGVDSLVTNTVAANGCRLSDQFAACEAKSNCTMKLIRDLRRDGTLSVHEANALRQASQVGFHSNRPR